MAFNKCTYCTGTGAIVNQEYVDALDKMGMHEQRTKFLVDALVGVLKPKVE